MSDSPIFWFHCGRCGSLFQAKAGLREDRLCSRCGFEPCTGVLRAEERKSSPQRAREVIHADEKPRQGTSKPTKPRQARGAEDALRNRGKKNRKFPLTTVLAVSWIALLLVIFIGARLLWPPDAAENKPHVATNRDHSSSDESAVSAEDIKFLNDEGQACLEVFSGFIAAGTPEERNQFVIRPVETVSRMAKFYSQNSIPKLEPSALTQKQAAVLHLPGGVRGIESRWETQDGLHFESLMTQENGEWKIDWEHFIRYGEEPFSLFLAGNDDVVAEFRLLARERLANERKTLETMSVVFYSPRFGRPSETGFQSPEFLVPRSSPQGQLLAAAFENARKGGTLFQSRIPEINPDGMVRVRVKIKRSLVANERKFELAEVLGCHWFSVSDPGLAPLPPLDRANPSPAR